MKDCRNCAEKEDLVRMLIEKTNECMALGVKLNAAKDAITDAVCKNKGQDRAEKAEAMQNELCRLAADNAAMTGELNELRGVNSMLRKVSSEKDELIDTLRKKNTALEKENDDLKKRLSDNSWLRQRCRSLEEADRRLAEEIREKDYELAQKEAKIRELEWKLKQNNDREEQHCSNYDDLIRLLNSQLAEAKEKIKRLELNEDLLRLYNNSKIRKLEKTHD